MALSACVLCKIRHFVAFRWHDASQVVWSLLPEPIYAPQCTALSAPLTISEEVVLHSMELGERCEPRS